MADKRRLIRRASLWAGGHMRVSRGQMRAGCGSGRVSLWGCHGRIRSR